MRLFRTGLIAVVVVVFFAVGAVMVFRDFDERRTSVALQPGVVVDHATCVAPEVLAAAIPARVQSPESLSVPLPPAGTVPDNFEPISVVVCQFLEYTDDSSEAVLSQTVRAGGHGARGGPVEAEVARVAVVREVPHSVEHSRAGGVVG